MQKALLIAEKPSLMRQIQAVYEKNKNQIPYEITFAAQRGHLVTLLEPDEMDGQKVPWVWEALPFFPEQHGGWRYKPIDEPRVGNNPTAQERLKSISKELKSGQYDFVINAGDPDQEGELLVRIVLEYLHNKLPVKRFWTNDTTPSHILHALQNLGDDDDEPFYRNLYAAALARQHSDWRFGMNITRAATIKMNGRIACGRVKTPILNIVCKREDEIENFKPKTVYGVKAVYEDGFDGMLFDSMSLKEGSDVSADDETKNGTVWFDDKEAAQQVADRLSKLATVTSCEKHRTETLAPKLYKLATLQVDAGKKGINDAETLRIIQGLYEKSLLSYPRTDCEYLSSNENYDAIIKAVAAVPELAPFASAITTADIMRVKNTKKWVNDKALEDAGHSAIRPTTKAVEFNSLTDDEKTVYTLICKRFLAPFMPPLVQDRTILITQVDDVTFRSSGKILVDLGFGVLLSTQFNDTVIPDKREGDVLKVEMYDVTEKTTVCPKRYTSPDLIAVCENPAKFLDDPSLKKLGKRLKIGTPATRSGIIKQLIERDKYLQIQKEKKVEYVVPTQTGRSIIKNLGDCDICKVDLTGLWEEQLEAIRQGRLSLPELEASMQQHVEDMIADIKSRDIKPLERKYTVIGKCPKCGKDLCEGAKGFFCMGYKATPPCGIGAFKDVNGTALTTENFLDLIAGKDIEITCGNGKNSWPVRLSYDFAGNKLNKVDLSAERICTCPKCGGDILAGTNSFRCSNGDVVGYRNLLGATMSDEDIIDTLNGQRITKTLTKDKKTWDQVLEFDFAHNRFSFVSEELELSDFACPICGETMREDGRKLTCHCGLTVWKVLCGHELTEDELADLLETGETEMIKGLKSRSGKKFSAKAVINETDKKVDLKFV